MSFKYQTLLGDSSVDADTIYAQEIDASFANIQNLSVGDFTLHNGAADDFVLTSDSFGVASWQPPAIPTLAGDVTGAANANTIANTIVTGKTLSGYSSLSGSIASSDTILQGLGKLDGTLGVPTNANTSSQIVKRDALGDFSARRITADLIGNANTVTTNANLTGEVTSIGNVATVPNATVIAKVLTGYVSGAGVVTAADSILTAIQKLNGNASAGGAVTMTGDVTGLSSANTIASSIVTGKLLTGFVSGAGTVASTDSLLQGFNKLNGNIGAPTNVNTASQIVKRDGTGGFAAGEITMTKLKNASALTVFDPSGTLRNTFAGISAGSSNGVSATDNTFLGYQAGLVNTAISITGLGSSALLNNTSGTELTAVGFESMKAHTTGVRNTAVGNKSMAATTTGINNVAIGSGANQFNVIGSNKVSIGTWAQQNHTGDSSVGIGYSALISSTSGSNVGIGTTVGYNVTTGSLNVLLGDNAGATITATNDNIMLGANSDISVNTLSNCIAIGRGAVCTASNQIKLGNASATSLVAPAITTTALTSSGLVTAGSLTTSGALSAGSLATGGTLTVTGAATVGSLSTGGTITATGNATAGSLSTGGTLAVTGAATVGSLSTVGVISTGQIPARKRITLYDLGTISSNGSHNYWGFGCTADQTVYQLPQVNSTTAHVFYAATSSSASNELFRISSQGGANMAGTFTATGGLITSGNATIGGNASVGGDLTVTGNVSYTAPVSIMTATWGNLSLGGGSPTGQVYYTRAGRTITMFVGGIAANVVATTYCNFGTTLPVADRPYNLAGFPVQSLRMTLNGVEVWGEIQLDCIAGTIRLCRASTGTFPAGSALLWKSFTISYVAST